MKIGISSYSFHTLLDNGVMTIEEVIKKAKEIGYDVIEFTDSVFGPADQMMENAKKVRAVCDETGIAAINIAASADLVYGAGGSGGGKAEVERLKKIVDVAHIIGAPKLRHDVTWRYPDASIGRSYRDVITYVAPFIRELSEYAGEKGIKTMSENHGRFMQDANRMEELVLTVNCKNYGLLVDMGNFLCADEDPVRAVGIVAPYAFHAHAKDFLFKPGTALDVDKSFFATRGNNYLRGTVIGHGVVPIRQCVNILKDAGYDDAISLEFEGLEEPSMAAALAYDLLKKIV